MRIEQYTIKDQLVERLKDKILKGELKPGEKIPTEVELSEMYDVGRSSVREALQHLLAIGLLERDKKAIYVARDITDIITQPMNLLIGMQKISPFHLFETRLVLEVAMAGIAAQRRTQEDLDRMNEIVYNMEHTDSVETFIEDNILFHTAIAAASKNPLLINLFEAIKEPLVEQQKQVIARGIARKSAFREHKEIIEAIADRDSERAEKKMDDHLRKGMEQFLKA
jgi:GntR family transcriptional repressor for pyruvate dehydrogenase complex